MQHTEHSIYLQPGEFHFTTAAATQIHTLLGSCVAISLWHPERKIGGLCHFALPSNPKPNETALNGRYGDDSIKLFKHAVIKCGTSMHEYQAKIFGGGNIQGGKTVSVSTNGVALSPSIGERNSAAALSYLLHENVPVLVAHVGEFGYRKLIFDVTTGCVWVKFTAMPATKNIDNLTGRA